MGSKHMLMTMPAYPIILGHRGVVLEHQENTAASLRRAVELGIDGVEIDVLLTKDKIPVLTHDPNLKRLTGQDVFIEDLTWAEVAELRIFKELTYGDVTIHYPNEEPFVRLEDVFGEFGGKILIDIDLKAKKLVVEEEQELGTIVGEMIRSHNLENSVFVTSFSVQNLHTLHKANPDVRSGFSYDRAHHYEFLKPMLGWLDSYATESKTLLQDEKDDPMVALRFFLEADAVGSVIGSTLVSCDAYLVDNDTVSKFHDKGKLMGVYTMLPLEHMEKELPKVVEPADDRYPQIRRDFEIMVGTRADWVITDDPQRFTQWRTTCNFTRF